MKVSPSSMAFYAKLLINPCICICRKENHVSSSSDTTTVCANVFYETVICQLQHLLTLSVHAREGYSSRLVCLSCSDFGDY